MGKRWTSAFASQFQLLSFGHCVIFSGQQVTPSSSFPPPPAKAEGNAGTPMFMYTLIRVDFLVIRSFKGVLKRSGCTTITSTQDSIHQYALLILFDCLFLLRIIYLLFQKKMNILHISPLSNFAYLVNAVCSPSPVHHYEICGCSASRWPSIKALLCCLKQKHHNAS